MPGERGGFCCAEQQHQKSGGHLLLFKELIDCQLDVVSTEILLAAALAALSGNELDKKRIMWSTYFSRQVCAFLLSVPSYTYNVVPLYLLWHRSYLACLPGMRPTVEVHTLDWNSAVCFKLVWVITWLAFPAFFCFFLVISIAIRQVRCPPTVPLLCL